MSSANIFRVTSSHKLERNVTGFSKLVQKLSLQNVLLKSPINAKQLAVAESKELELEMDEDGVMKAVEKMLNSLAEGRLVSGMSSVECLRGIRPSIPKTERLI